MNKMTNKEAAARYLEKAKELAVHISKIADIRNSFKFISEQTEDSGDPWFTLDEAMTKLGEALANAIVYADEYEKDVD